jgi:2-polyprenyl-3-methyl-5-hydroxy-6-metoxy-1,4-benzoquinol methylase
MNNGTHMSTLKTFSRGHIQRHRETHLRFARFGTHAHPYLHGPLRKVAETIATKERRLPTLLDYGCGKGSFMNEIRKLSLFSDITGYDPGVDAYLTRPAGRFDIVTCLDVLDQSERRFVDSIIQDIAGLTTVAAIFSLISKQREKRPETQPLVLHQAVEKHMPVVQMTLRRSSAIELAQGAALERVIIVAEPRK